MQTINYMEAIFFLIGMWLVIAVMTLSAAWKSSAYFRQSKTPAVDNSIAIGISLFVGVAVTGCLWLIFGTLVMIVPDINTEFVFLLGSFLSILIPIVSVFYPKLRELRAIRYNQYSG